MKIELTGMLQSASGPYGGRANRLKLVTRHDGQVLLVPRKGSMTGDRDHPVHAWSRLNWIYVDALWSSLPRRIRAVWGMCARRTTDKASSSLDEFRHVNMPRALLGFPLLRLPPDRFRSYCTYLPRPPQYSRHNKRPPAQVWLAGFEKPEPPWVPAPDEPVCPFPDCHPPPPPPFSVLQAPEPHPFVCSASCTYPPCPDNVTYCYDQLYCMPEVAFETKPGSGFFLWKANTNPERTQRDPVWLIQTEILSEKTWGDSDPYERLMAENVQCYTGTYEGTPLPWQAAWCVKLTHWSAKAVKLSYGYYWRDPTALCPYGEFELAWVHHVYGAYPWPDILYVEPTGDLIDEPPPCPPLISGILPNEHPTTIWFDYSNKERWAGFTWNVDSARSAYVWEHCCAGPAWLNVTDITCCDTPPREGMWYFKCTVLHAGHHVLLEYRKPVVPGDMGIYGTYFLHDPGDFFPWASIGVLVYNELVDWHDKMPTLSDRLLREIACLIIGELIGILAARGLSFLRAWARLGTGYSGTAVASALRAARPVRASLTGGSYRCLVKYGMTPGMLQNIRIANEAMRRRGLFAGIHMF